MVSSTARTEIVIGVSVVFGLLLAVCIFLGFTNRTRRRRLRSATRAVVYPHPLPRNVQYVPTYPPTFTYLYPNPPREQYRIVYPNPPVPVHRAWPHALTWPSSWHRQRRLPSLIAPPLPPIASTVGQGITPPPSALRSPVHDQPAYGYPPSPRSRSSRYSWSRGSRGDGYYCSIFGRAFGRIAIALRNALLLSHVVVM
ncbi:hypothetical protein SISNIDRAFT_460451 [Sistotremastrum niveocremeum HHB9708]|uniref:Uncharacterized protein n=2 Tax=Sistotremastraceae TaxID=3402574 RepID=A0A164NLW1_9AGAM|nr:hypothetical protein SISNIDRAFT_460451 [Sistotremastrum niveocremeum HHB9708]KZT33910.1 hypothetical protein SISSUDRAFT_1053636 [Sistotremastrum suecicum HHB10207 ss-3]